MNKHGFHRAFAVLLAVFLMLTGISLNATAETAVAQVGEQTYSSLADAVNAVNEDKGAEPLSLTLLTDVVVETAKFTVSRGNVMIDGGGHTLTVTGNAKRHCAHGHGGKCQRPESEYQNEFWRHLSGGNRNVCDRKCIYHCSGFYGEQPCAVSDRWKRLG